MPEARRWAPWASQVRSDQRAKLDHPASNRFATDFDSALGESFIDIPDAEREAKIQPHRLADHIRREPMALSRKSSQRRLIAPNRRPLAVWLPTLRVISLMKIKADQIFVRQEPAQSRN